MDKAFKGNHNWSKCKEQLIMICPAPTYTTGSSCARGPGNIMGEGEQELYKPKGQAIYCEVVSPRNDKEDPFVISQK